MALTDADLPKLVQLLNQIDIRVKLRRRTAAQWAAANEILLDGEYGLETDTRKLKIGDGLTPWLGLAYQPGAEGVLGCTFDGGGDVIAVGAAVDVVVPWNCLIVAASIVGEPSGSIAISVWADTLANYPPTAGDNIAGATPPTISSATHGRDDVLSGWSRTLAKGAIVRFTVASCSAIQRATLALEVLKL